MCDSRIVMQILVPLIVALVPLLITPNLLYYFDITPKIVLLLLGAAIVLLLYRENGRNLASFLGTRIGRWFTLLLSAHWIWLAISTALSTHASLSLNGSNWRRFGLITETALLIFVLSTAAWLAQDRRNVRTLLLSVSASGAIGGIYGIVQYCGFDPMLPANAYQAGEGPFTIVRPPGTLGHADYFAAWLVSVVFCSIALSTRFAWAVAVLASISIVLSGTRSAMLGLLAGLLVVFLSRSIRANAAMLATTAGVIACFSVLLLTPGGEKIRARLHWSLDDARGGARLLLWRDTLRMVSARPLFGFGPETFTTEFPRFQSIELARAYPDFYHESPHNVFLDTAAGQGWPAAIVLVALCGLSLYTARGSPVAAGLVAVLGAQQFTAFVPATALSFYLLVAICVAQAFVPVLPSCPQRTHAITLVLPILSAPFVLCAARLLTADHALATAHHRIDASDPTGAAAAYQTVLHWQPSGAGSDLEYSRQMAALANRTPVFRTRLEAWQQAIQAAVRATQTAEDRHNAWYNLAILLAAQNDSHDVERSLRNAIQWAPNWFKPHWTLAQILELTNRHPEAVAQAAAAVRMNDKDAEVIGTWIKLTGKGVQ